MERDIFTYCTVAPCEAQAMFVSSLLCFSSLEDPGA